MTQAPRPLQTCALPTSSLSKQNKQNKQKQTKRGGFFYAKKLKQHTHILIVPMSTSASTPPSSPAMQSIQAPSIQAQRHAAVIARRAVREAEEVASAQAQCALRCPEPEKEGHDEWCSMLTESARRVVEAENSAHLQSECQRITEATLALGSAGLTLNPEYIVAALDFDRK